MIMVGLSVGVDVRYLDMISCKFLIDQSCSYPIENGNGGEVFLTASDRFYIMQRAASVERSTVTGQSCGKIRLFFPLSQR